VGISPTKQINWVTTEVILDVKEHEESDANRWLGTISWKILNRKFSPIVAWSLQFSILALVPIIFSLCVNRSVCYLCMCYFFQLLCNWLWVSPITIKLQWIHVCNELLLEEWWSFVFPTLRLGKVRINICEEIFYWESCLQSKDCWDWSCDWTIKSKFYWDNWCQSKSNRLYFDASV
jgi:hypothetical protein